EELDAPPGGGGGARHCLPSFSRRGGFTAHAARQVSWLPGVQRAPLAARRPAFPGLDGPSGYVGPAPRLQWRDRAGIRPASLTGPFGGHGGGVFLFLPSGTLALPGGKG